MSAQEELQQADIVDRLLAKAMHKRDGLERCSGDKYCSAISTSRRAVECSCRIREEAAEEIKRLRVAIQNAPQWMLEGARLNDAGSDVPQGPTSRGIQDASDTVATAGSALPKGGDE